MRYSGLQARAHHAAVQRARRAARAERDEHHIACWTHRLHAVRRALKLYPLVVQLYAQRGTLKGTATELNRRHLSGLYGDKTRWSSHQVREVLDRGEKHA